MKSYLVIVLLVLETASEASGLGKKLEIKRESKIVGGTTATLAQFPYQVRILIIVSGNTAYQCGGSILNASTILTAAHCFHDESTGALLSINSVMVYAGFVTISPADVTQQVQQASKWILNQNYVNSNHLNDMALLILAAPFTLNAYVSPILLPASNDNFDNQNCVVSGWGLTSSGGSISNTLQYATVTAISSSSCTQTYQQLEGISVSSTIMCTSTSNTDSCQGDSGGPVVCTGATSICPTCYQKVLAGVVSSGIGCASGTYPAFNTRVTSFLSWISAQMGTSQVTGNTTETVTTAIPADTVGNNNPYTINYNNAANGKFGLRNWVLFNLLLLVPLLIKVF